MSHALSAGHLVAATKRFREREIRYAFNAPLLRNCGRFDIGRPETRSGLDRSPPHLRLETISVRNTHVRCRENFRLSLPSLAKNLPRGSRRNQCGGGHGGPPVLGEVPHELSTVAHSKECKRSPQQFIPAGFPSTTNFPRGRKTQSSPHHTGHGRFRTRPPTSS